MSQADEMTFRLMPYTHLVNSLLRFLFVRLIELEMYNVRTGAVYSRMGGFVIGVSPLNTDLMDIVMKKAFIKLW